MLMLKKGVNIISWVCLIVLGVVIFINWNNVDAQSQISGGFLFGNKTVVVIVFVVAIVANLLFTFHYDIPYIKELKKTIQSPTVINLMGIFIQISLISVASVFILKAFI